MTRASSFITALACATLLATSSWAQTATKQAEPPKHLTIFAAASLTDALPKVAAAWKHSGGSDVTFNFDASSRLAKQISMGAPADAFFSADEEWMDFLAKPNLLTAGSRVSLLSNDLVVIVPKAAASEPFDIKKIRKLGLAGEHVPAGKYAQAALTYEKQWDDIKENVVRGDNVRTVLAWTSTGNIDAGVVYLSDALSAKDKVRVVHTFSKSSHPAISYPAAVIKQSTQQKTALAFLAFCRSSEAAAIFKDAGFHTEHTAGQVQ